MLAITANWGMTDASLADSRVRQAAGWLEAIRRGVVRAGSGRDGRYCPVGEVTLIFAGDSCDLLLSDVWAEGDRPWHAGSRSMKARASVVAASVRAAWPVIRVLHRWARRGIVVPAATGRGRPSEWAVCRVPLRLVLLAGDRDWWLGEESSRAARLGMACGEEWFDDCLHVRHGHDLDPLAHRPRGHALSEQTPTVAESLVTDCIVPFAVATRNEIDLWRGVRPRLSRLSMTRPSEMPAIITRLAASAPTPVLHRQIVSLWRRAVAGWHARAHRDMPACEIEFDAIGALAAWLDRADADVKAPPAIRRLDAFASPRMGSQETMVTHHRPALSPMLSCSLPDGRRWQEHLGSRPPIPAIVAVGNGAAGPGFVDAA